YMDSDEDYNVICVDWGPLARSTGPLSSIFYPFVVENVPRVGEKSGSPRSWDCWEYIESEIIPKNWSHHG
ncbi:unnamed protein product, partial [Allacma fusca]